MAKSISEMSSDLAKAMEQHARESQTAVNAAAEQMAVAAASLSTPLYGVSVQASTVSVSDGRKVNVAVKATDGPGSVQGGVAAVTVQAARAMDRVAKEDGLARRR